MDDGNGSTSSIQRSESLVRTYNGVWLVKKRQQLEDQDGFGSNSCCGKRYLVSDSRGRQAKSVFSIYIYTRNWLKNDKVTVIFYTRKYVDMRTL